MKKTSVFSLKKIMFLYDAVQTSKQKKYDLQGLARET